MAFVERAKVGKMNDPNIFILFLCPAKLVKRWTIGKVDMLAQNALLSKRDSKERWD